MHYRITKVYHKIGKLDDMITYIKSVDDKLNSIEGLNSVKMISISDNQVIAVSEYNSEDQLTAAEQHFGSIMAGMQSFMESPPEVNNGDMVWEYNRW